MKQIRRERELARTDRTDLDSVLDAAAVGTLATVVDGQPWVVPMLYARDGDRVVLH
ncbi:MAG: pyridoxamine 5'-phosphate oxidase family protein, partial [Pseudonocardia sp.]